MENILDQVKSKKLIFTITTGRSGTKYLSYLLSLFPDFKSEHEAVPAFHDYMREVLSGNYDPKKFWIEKKLPYIAALKENYYSDVSHVAAKGFLDSLLEFDLNTSFILLKRDNRSVAKSLLRLNTIPGKTELGLKYLVGPSDKNFLPKLRANELSDYQLCYWYTKETEARMEHYKKVFIQKKINFVELEFEELTSKNILLKLRENLNLKSPKIWNQFRFLKNLNRKINKKEFLPDLETIIDYDLEERKLMELSNV